MRGCRRREPQKQHLLPFLLSRTFEVTNNVLETIYVIYSNGNYIRVHIVVFMKLELSVSKKMSNTVSGPIQEVLLTVVDLDKSKSYPMNFVCMLPRSFGPKKGEPTKFVKIYGEDSTTIATKLLNKALKKETDPEVRADIEKRLKSLAPKPTVKCPVCGCEFTPKRYGNLMQRICNGCRNKNSFNQ